LPKLDPEQQRAFAVAAVEKLRAAGFEAYWAGGCVRDRLLGRDPKDYDVATNATPDEIRHLFTKRRTLAVGAAFGVIAVLGPPSAGQIEVATFRQDAAYSDGRHPDAVSFSTPEADAQRRDFTINGLFYDPLEDEVIDFVGGQADLAQGIVRAIGDPQARFVEDKLRLLRAVRFAATFDFALDAATLAAIVEMGPQIVAVSAERVAAEMRLMLASIHRSRAVALLRKVGLLNVLLPELSEATPTAIATTQRVLEALAEAEFPLALAGLLHAVVEPAACLEIGRRWKLANRETERTHWLLEKQRSLVNASQTPWPKLQRLLIAEGIEDLLALHAAIAHSAAQPATYVDYCRELLKKPPEELNPAPLITGDDLITHGVPRGKLYRWLLDAVRDAQLEKQVTTRAEALALVDRLRTNPPTDGAD
jgi:poly(A) polymerase